MRGSVRGRVRGKRERDCMVCRECPTEEEAVKDEEVVDEAADPGA